jgi:hypothetical protein
MDSAHLAATTRRTVIQGDSRIWLAENQAAPGDSVITSLPDVSELAGLSLEQWQSWFISTARSIIRWLPDDCVAIFFQSDVRYNLRWVDKGYLIAVAAEEEGAFLVWHKIVCRRPAGTVSVGRPSYSHMLCVSRSQRGLPIRPGPDVLPDAGYMPWSRAMGVEACRVACQFLRDETPTKRVVDPFCGHGTALAVANALGLDALGIELGGKRCRIARNLSLEPSQLVVTERSSFERENRT